MAQRVIVVVEEGGEPGGEAVLLSVMIEAIPEDELCLFGGEGVEAIATP